MMHLAVVYSSLWGQTEKIASRIADRLRSAGHAVIFTDVEHPPSPDALAALDGIVIGAWVRGGRYTSSTRRFVERHLGLLSHLPSAFFSVGLLQISPREDSRLRAAEVLPRFLQETAWKPDLTATFAGALKFTRFGWFGKRIMRMIWRREGLDVDMTRDYEYTRWEEVDRFADAVASMLPVSAHLKA